MFYWSRLGPQQLIHYIHFNSVLTGNKILEAASAQYMILWCTYTLLVLSDLRWYLHLIHDTCLNFKLFNVHVWYKHLFCISLRAPFIILYSSLWLWSPHPWISSRCSPNNTTWQALCDSFRALSEPLSLSEILISRRVSPAGPSNLSRGAVDYCDIQLLPQCLPSPKCLTGAW